MNTAATAELVTGIWTLAPVAGIVTEVRVFDCGDDEDFVPVTVSTMTGPVTHWAAQDETWELHPEHTFAFEPDELYALRDGDSWVFVGADLDSEEAARAWVGKHYPTAAFQVGGTW